MIDPPGPPPAPTHIEYRFLAHGVVLVAFPAEGDPIRIFLPNRWLLPLALAFKGRIKVLADEGAFRAGAK